MFTISDARHLILLALLFVCVYPLVAQRDAASLQGQVVDSSDAVVAKASVVAANTPTSLSYDVQSNAADAWSISLRSDLL